jgi:hypothetical protein
MWRKNHLDTFARAQAARKRNAAIRSAVIPVPLFNVPESFHPDRPEMKKAAQTAEMLAREELGRDYIFVEMEDLADPAGLLVELEVIERLDARIDKLFKRLAMLQAFQSLSSSKSLPSGDLSRTSGDLPRISGPKEAA